MKVGRYSQWKFIFALAVGASIALALCVQCIKTYLYTDAVLVPQQAEHEAARQVGVLSAAARSAGIGDPRKLGTLMERALESASDRVLWMRVLDLDGNVLAQAGSPERAAKFPAKWWDRVQNHEKLGTFIETAEGKALVVMLPLRLPHPMRPPPEADALRHDEPHPHSADPHDHPPIDRHTSYVLEQVISLKAVAGSFEGLQQNLIVGLIASIALLLSVAVIGFRAPHYFRGKYLESELQLAKRVQSDLQPKPHSRLPHVEFAASAVAADHVGGDFHDIFEAETGETVFVLGDVSGKGVPAALLVSVLQGAIRSSTAFRHEQACERINRMLCERTACERFATLFWGVFDPVTSVLRYVNAGHAAPMLLRSRDGKIERLNQGGGPVAGLVPTANYSAGTVRIEDSDLLIMYSDGINEASGKSDEEFGEDRLQNLISKSTKAMPGDLCERIMDEVSAFASAGVPADDRTLMVIKFLPSKTSVPDAERQDASVAARA